MSGKIDAAYWAGRFTQLEQSTHREAEKVMRDVESAYREAAREMEAQISTWYRRFADNNGIVSMAEARRLLNSRELAEFKWTVGQYAQHAKENGVTADWTKQLENASARWHISRLEALKVQMQNTVEVLYGNQLDSLDALAKNTFLFSYNHTAFEIQRGTGIGFDIAGLNQKAIQAAIYKPWTVDGRNFSDRIWANKEALINELHKQLSQNLMMGGNLDRIVETIEKKMGVSKYNAGRLVYTENAYIQAVATGESYRATGVKMFQFIATLDERTSEICQSMDGNTYDMKDYQPGVTVPPLHPWCRSCTAPYFSDMAGIGERFARNPDDGTRYFVPRDMKYPEWEKTFVQGGTKAGLTQATPNNNSDLATKLPNGHYAAMQKLLADCGNPDLQRVWAAHESEIKVGNANYKNGDKCVGDTIYIDAAGNAKGSTFEKPFGVNFHEAGHAIDGLVKEQAQGFTPHFSSRYKNGLFPQTIKQEVDSLVDAKAAEIKAQYKAHEKDYDWLIQHGYLEQWNYDWFKKYGTWIGGEPKYSKSLAYKAIEKEISALNPFQKADLSDMMQGASNEKINIGYGHRPGYWRKRTYGGVSDGLATEAFAEMVSATTSNPESLETIKKYIPKSYQVFCDMLKDLK